MYCQSALPLSLGNVSICTGGLGQLYITELQDMQEDVQCGAGDGAAVTAATSAIASVSFMMATLLGMDSC